MADKQQLSMEFIYGLIRKRMLTNMGLALLLSFQALASSVQAAEPKTIRLDAASPGRVFEGIGARQRRGFDAVAAGLPEAAAERGTGFPVQAEIRRGFPASQGGDRRRRKLDLRQRALARR